MAVAYDADTDEQIPHIKRVDWVAVDVNNHVYEARLVVDVCEIEGEIAAPSRIEPTFTNAEFDEITRRVADRMRHPQLRLLEEGEAS